MEFRNVTHEDKLIFNKFSEFPTYSDFNLLSLLSWNANDDNAYTLLYDNLVLRFKDYLGDGYVYSVLGSSDIDNTIDSLIEEFGALSMVPECVVELLSDKDQYNISEDRDNFDYLISLKKLSELEGSDLKTLRRYIKKFIQATPEYETRVLNIEDSADKSRILNLTESWVKQKEFDDEKMVEEFKSINAFINFSQYFDCVAIGLFINEHLVAFTFNEITPSGVIMGHFGKANNDVPYSSYFVEVETAKYFYNLGFVTMNHEQDTGLAGLRATKLTYAPTGFLRKFTITKN